MALFTISLGGIRVAMRQGDVVHFLHTDHLGSTSLTTDATGAPIAQTRYLPYGEQRWTDGDTPTDFTFTGQRADSFGLLDYNARYYDSGLGRFISPDTVIPDPTNLQNFNRYSYGYNNPVKFVDRDGHFPIPIVLVPLAKILLEGGGILLGMWAIQQEPVQDAIDSTAQGIGEGGRKVVDFVEETLINGSVEAYPLEDIPNPCVYQQPTLAMPGWEPILSGPSLQENGPVTFGLEFPLSNLELPTVLEARSNTLQPDPNAVGPHSVFRRDPVTGQVSNYQTFIPQTNLRDPKPFESTLRFRGSGIPHYNKVTDQSITPPLVHDPNTPGGVRKPNPDELPGGY